MKRIKIWCVNDETYYQTKAEAREDMSDGDTLSRVTVEGESFKEIICDALNLMPIIVEELSVK